MKKVDLKSILNKWSSSVKSKLTRSTAYFAILLLMPLFIILIFTLETCYVQPSNAAEKTNFLSMIGGLLGGGALLLGVYFTWKQLQIALDGKITDRISQAVEHIGSENLSVRLGGLYSLERIALDSDRDLPKIIEILCAYIRVSSPSEVIDRENHAVAISRELTDEELDEIVQGIFNRPIRIREDIQVALQIIAKVARLSKVSEDRLLVVSRNLFGVNISGVRLPEKTDLSHFFIDSSQLDYIIFPLGSKLVESRICNANMRGAIMEGANLRSSDLSGSAMEYIIFRRATLDETRFLSSRLTRANFTEASAVKANFNQAMLREVSFSKAILREADFGFADLREIRLDGADLRKVTFVNANLSQANFKDAQLDEANLYRANLIDARELTEEQLSKAVLCQTTLPDGTTSNRDCERLKIDPEAE